MGRIEFPASYIKNLRALRRWLEQIIKSGNRTIVQIWCSCPNTIEGTSTVGEDSAKIIRPSFVNLNFNLRILGRLIFPLLDDSTSHDFGGFMIGDVGRTANFLKRYGAIGKIHRLPRI